MKIPIFFFFFFLLRHTELKNYNKVQWTCTCKCTCIVYIPNHYFATGHLTFPLYWCACKLWLESYGPKYIHKKVSVYMYETWSLLRLLWLPKLVLWHKKAACRGDLVPPIIWYTGVPNHLVIRYSRVSNQYSSLYNSSSRFFTMILTTYLSSYDPDNIFVATYNSASQGYKNMLCTCNQVTYCVEYILAWYTRTMTW